MTHATHTEKDTQNRVIKLFEEDLDYEYLGDWSKRDGNSNIEEGLLTQWLESRDYTPAQVSKAIHSLLAEANNPNRDLYHNNEAVYALLRYGVQVKVAVEDVTETVHLIDWTKPKKNNFAIAEEVTLKGKHERRPDLVLYVNGIAIGVIELKSGKVDVGQGITQSLSNQKPEFNAWFYSTVQFVFAGNDSQGLRYGAIGTPAKYFLEWREDEGQNLNYKLDKYLLKVCKKKRIIELMRDFVLFDAGVKKLPRAHQYFGIKAAQASIKKRKGGIIWHTQGSGKSIVMVLLAKWILAHNPAARVVVITDRDELDKQIESVFRCTGEEMTRASSGQNLLSMLAKPSPRLLCTLVHKFAPRDLKDKDLDAYVKQLEAQPSPTVGEVFVFVDECHRTHGKKGTFHKMMKAMMPNAVFIGFTGTPLLKKDRATSQELFGRYIHTYKFSEGVRDKVILDLIYEARDIDQTLGSQDKIDLWFEAKTKGLNDWQKHELKSRWGTMQKVLSSKSRMHRVVTDIIFDFDTKDRLSDHRGNAILVASSIYEACKYFVLFEQTVFKGRCAVVTSYNPQAKDISLEATGANTDTDKEFIYHTYTELLKDVDAAPGKSKTETYEDQAKALFVKEPANMKLLVVVDKLLTGFDAPPCTYLYIDKSMQDHGLFQAICRVNRLDDDTKNFGYVVDYKDLFKKVEKAIAVYTSEVDDSSGGASPEVTMQSRLDRGKKQLDSAIEALVLLCEKVEPPKEVLQYLHYFCGNTEFAEQLKETAHQRVALYKATVNLLRAYGAICDDLEGAGYSPTEIKRIKGQLKHYVDIRDSVRNASGETLDLKPFEADMRHLIDSYIDASEPRKVSPFDNLGLLDLIVKTGIADAIALRLKNLKGNKRAISESIENNVRSTIIKNHLLDPEYYERMSALLQQIIADRKAMAIEYEEYLKKIAELAKKVAAGADQDTPDVLKYNPGLRALYNNLKKTNMPTGKSPDIASEDVFDDYTKDPDPVLARAQAIDAKVRQVRPDGWRGVQTKELVIKKALFGLLKDEAEVERLFVIIKAQSDY